MRNIASIALLGASFGLLGCGNGGTGATGATGGSGSGSALVMDAETALPAMGATAGALAFSADLGETFAAVIEAITLAPAAAVSGPIPKIDVPVDGRCPGGGSVSVDWEDQDLDGFISAGDVITVVLTNCVGVGFGAASVSGDATMTISSVSSDGLLIEAAMQLDVTIDSDTRVQGPFAAKVDLARFGQIILTLGDALDGDQLVATESGQETLRLGCFEITLVFEQVSSGGLQLVRITPFSVASLAMGPAGLAAGVYTVNDYSPRITGIGQSVSFDATGLPQSGRLALFGGDDSGIDDVRSEEGKQTCPGFGGAVNGSSVEATFSPGGCAALSGVDDQGTPFQLETNWEKLIEGDSTPGGGPGCGMGGARSHL